MMRKSSAVTLALTSAMSVTVAPLVVVLIGLRIRGPLGDPELSALQFVAFCLMFGVLQFGLLFLPIGLVAGCFSLLSDRQSVVARLALRVTAIFIPTVLFPFAAVAAIVWSNRGGIPMIQDTTPYFKGAFPAGFLVGVLTVVFAMRGFRTQSAAGSPK